MRGTACVMLAATLCAATAANAGSFTPSPPELMRVFDSYTKKMGIDPKTCRLGIWNDAVFLSTRKATFANHFATCPVPGTYKVCTRLAPELTAQVTVEKDCITGLNRVSFLPIAAVTPVGGYFVVVHETEGKPLRLIQQLTLGFGEKRDFCEMSANLIDEDAKEITGKTYHHFTDLLADPKACLAEAPP
jgi:hypothetical protein